MAKCVHSGACTSSAKQSKTGTDPKWSADFPWMLVVDDGQGMMCSLPQAQPSSPESCHRKSYLGGLSLQEPVKQSLVKNSKSESHISAVQMEADLVPPREMVE